MRFEFIEGNGFLLIKLSGIPLPNERAVTKESILRRLHGIHPRVIVDLSDIKEKAEVYVLGVLNTLRKEVRIRGGEMKLCALGPTLYRFFQQNRLLDMFQTESTVEQAKRSFGKSADESK
jgi:anti-anti-sigma regulatory factor